MILSGLLTTSMLYFVIWPEAAVKSMFGSSLGGPAANVIVRDWGFLIFLTGVLLIYGAYHPLHRRLIILFACAGKIMFVGLIFFLSGDAIASAWPAMAFDATVTVLLLVAMAGTVRTEIE